MPEPRIQQVQYGVLRSSDVKVHRHPVLLLLGVNQLPSVGRVNEPEVVPAGPSPLRHRRGLPMASNHGGVTDRVTTFGRVTTHLFAGPPETGTVVLTQLSIAASGLSGVPLGLKGVDTYVRTS